MSNKKGPLYYVIKEDIKRKIEAGELKKGEILPTEKSLCEEYKVSRVTIRRTIEALIDEDILERGFGKTATVKYEPVPRSMNSLRSLHEELEKAGIKCSSFILSSQVINAPNDINAKMELNPDEKVFRIERLRYADGAPLCYQLLYLRHSKCENLDVRRMVNTSLYKLLQEEMGVKIDLANQTIQAVMSSFRISALLELPEQTCMLLVNRTAYDDAGECFEYSKSYYVSNRYSLSMILTREEQSL